VTRGRWRYVVVLALAASAFLLPQVWLLSLSLKEKTAVYQYPPRWIPDEPTLGNYLFAFQQTQVPWYLVNSAAIAVLATLATLLVALPAAYVLSRERFPERGPLLAGMLGVQMLSPVILLVPIYGLVERLGLLDTHGGLILVYAGIQIPFTVWVLKGFFDGLPTSVFEAAILDGATPAQVLRRIALPVIAPGLAAAAIFNVAAYWSEFAIALVLLDSQEKFTVPIGLFSMQGAYETEWQLVAAAGVVALLPVMAAFVLLQRYFIAGLTAGATKG
jgi:multiple sugar transport system permease protein